MREDALPVRLKRFRWTIAGGVFGLLFVLTGVVSGREVFDYLIHGLRYLEALTIDEALLIGGLILVGLLIDLNGIRKQKKRAIVVQEQRLRVLRATMVTVHHIVNNFLNNLQVFRLEAETKQSMSPDSLRLMGSLIQETSAELKAIGELDTTPETELAGGLIGIDYKSSREERISRKK